MFIYYYYGSRNPNDLDFRSVATSALSVRRHHNRSSCVCRQQASGAHRGDCDDLSAHLSCEFKFKFRFKFKFKFKLIYFANTNMIQERQIVYICDKETLIKTARSR